LGARRHDDEGVVAVSRSRGLIRLVAAATLGAALVVVAAPAALAQPANDDFANATVITELPFSQVETTYGATSEPTDPIECGGQPIESVWFAFTPPSDMFIEADTIESQYNTLLSAWTGTQGALNLVACNDDSDGEQSRITFPATAGTTYYFMVTVSLASGPLRGLQFHVNQLLPPGNDDFADAAPIGALPFSDQVNLTAATTQPSEPSPSCVGLQNTAWYAFTPAATQSVSARIPETYGAGFGVYTGTALADLTEVGCSQYSYSQPLVFQAQANTTYYFQVGGWCCEGFGQVTFLLEVTPNPVAEFFYSPGDPSVFDPVQFVDTSSDPAGVGIASQAWRFGDGATAEGGNPTHQYAQDGDYTVEFTVTTPDGRTGSTSQVVHVETHDVAVVKVDVPSSARVGRTIRVDVRVRNTRYPETVQVDLSKSVPAGFQQFGSLTQSVPVRPRNQTTLFAFTYTITAADQSIGRVSFRAVATMSDHRDAFPADNEFISRPVKVT
jgi:PKD repeat protein